MSYSFDRRCESCERPSQHDFPEGGGAANRHLVCSHCDTPATVAEAAIDADGQLRDPIAACLSCGSDKMYTQKDFNRKLGVLIVVVGAIFSPWTYGLSLVACMAFDYGLYYFVPEVTVCYACDAIHRGFEHNPLHRAHDPLLAERFKHDARAEMGLEQVEIRRYSDHS